MAFILKICGALTVSRPVPGFGTAQDLGLSRTGGSMGHDASDRDLLTLAEDDPLQAIDTNVHVQSGIPITMTPRYRTIVPCRSEKLFRHAEGPDAIANNLTTPTFVHCLQRGHRGAFSVKVGIHIHHENG